MLPYYGLFFLAVAAGLLLCEWKKSRGRDLIYLIMMASAMVAMAAIRGTSVGVDYPAYAEYFSAVRIDGLAGSALFQGEGGFRLFTYLISLCTGNVAVYMGIISAAIILLRAWAIWRQSSSIWMSVVVYIGFGFFSYAMCTLRQELAISVALFALPFLQQRRILPYLLIVALAGTFHMSLWILLPVYFLARLPLNKLMLIIYGGGVLTMILLTDPILSLITRYIYKHYQPGSPYLQGRNLSTLLIPVALALVGLLLQKSLLKRNPANLVLLNFSCWAGLLFMLTVRTFIYQRVALIFLPVAIFLIPELLNSIAFHQEEYDCKMAVYQADRVNRKQSKQQITALITQRKTQISLYYTTMALFGVGSLLYFAFLLSANRLLLVPYVTMF